MIGKGKINFGFQFFQVFYHQKKILFGVSSTKILFFDELKNELVESFDFDLIRKIESLSDFFVLISLTQQIIKFQSPQQLQIVSLLEGYISLK